MSLIYNIKFTKSSFINIFNDYYSEVKHFARRIRNPLLKILMIILKSIEWGIYHWYKSSIRRFYGVRGNELIFNITKRCNEKCAKCGIWKNPEKDDERLSIDVFIQCLNALKKNLYQVTITGGEPLLFKDEILKIAKEARENNIPVVTVTNGVLSDEIFVQKYGEMKHILVFSIDTLNKEKWKILRGTASYNIVMNNLNIAKKILGKRLQIQTVLAKENKDDINEIVTYCKKNNLKHTIQPYMDFGGHLHPVEKSSNNTSNMPCAARKNIVILQNGDVIKCFDHYRIPYAKLPLGNIKHEDIITILCKRRSIEVSRIMKYCNLPCKNLSCNIPATEFYD